MVSSDIEKVKKNSGNVMMLDIGGSAKTSYVFVIGEDR